MRYLIILILLLQNFNCKAAPLNTVIDEDTPIRYIEIYGSVCCPRDYKFDTHLLEFIKTFENTYHVKLESNYKLILGREGEAAYFLSLDNLSEELREKFVTQRLAVMHADDKAIKNYLNKTISLKEALLLWNGKTVTNLLKL